jgi:predicted ATPase
LDRHREADEAYATAVSSARDQGAVSLELRALTSLLAHRFAHGDAQSTRSELQALVASIPVSPGRRDMIEASALLIESMP